MIIKTTLLDTQSSKNKSWSKQVLNSMIFSETMKDNSTLNKVFSMRKWHYTQSNNSQYNYVFEIQVWLTYLSDKIFKANDFTGEYEEKDK